MIYAKKHVMFFELLFLALLVSACSTSPQAINDRALAKWAESGNTQAVSQLLSAGADVNAKGNSGATPLHTAAWWGNREVAELLINKGADVNARNNNKSTPLHYVAAEMGDRELTELLIAKGADINARNIYDRSPLDYAINRKSDDVVEVLRQHGAK